MEDPKDPKADATDAADAAEAKAETKEPKADAKAEGPKKPKAKSTKKSPKPKDVTEERDPWVEDGWRVNWCYEIGWLYKLTIIVVRWKMSKHSKLMGLTNSPGPDLSGWEIHQSLLPVWGRTVGDWFCLIMLLWMLWLGLHDLMVFVLKGSTILKAVPLLKQVFCNDCLHNS